MATPLNIYGMVRGDMPQQQTPSRVYDPSHPNSGWSIADLNRGFGDPAHDADRAAVSRSAYYGGSQWNGQAWVPYDPSQEAKAYSSPYAMPQNYDQLKRNILSNPLFMAQASDPTSPQAAALAALLAEDKANADTERNFGNALGALGQGYASQAGSLDQGEASALGDAKRAYGRATGSTGASLQSRGLYNTTLFNSLQNRNAESYGRTAGSIRGNFAEQRGRNAYGYGTDVAKLWGARSSVGAGQGSWANLMQGASMPRTAPAARDSGSDNSGLYGMLGSLGSAGILALAAL